MREEVSVFLKKVGAVGKTPRRKRKRNDNASDARTPHNLRAALVDRDIEGILTM